VLDTGINMTHPEFLGRLVDGWNFVDTTNTKGKDVTDDQGHGTGVAGVAAANGNNGQLVAGVDWNCKIMPIKVIAADGSALSSNVILGVRFAADNGANVINMSLGGYGEDPTFPDAVTYANSKGAILVASMGNDNSSSPLYPASIPGVIAVGATNARDQRAVPFTCPGEAGSNYGNSISFVAPGDYLYGLDYSRPWSFYIYREIWRGSFRNFRIWARPEGPVVRRPGREAGRFAPLLE
jgi:subtilisin family serine protease